MCGAHRAGDTSVDCAMQANEAPGLTESEKTDASQKTTGAAFAGSMHTGSTAGAQLLHRQLDAQGSGVLAVGYCGLTLIQQPRTAALTSARACCCCTTRYSSLAMTHVGMALCGQGAATCLVVEREAETIYRDRRAGADQVQAAMLAEMQKQTRLLQKIEANSRSSCKSHPRPCQR